MQQKTVVELEGVNGERFILAGPGAGDQGVFLGTDVKGLYDPPVKAVYEEPGNWPGARYLNHRVQKREITFGVEIVDHRSETWASRESVWRKAWAFDRDCKLYVTTMESGTRYLKLRLAESPEVSWFSDPNEYSVNRTVMVCVALDPYWYEDDAIFTAVTTLDTRFNPIALGIAYPWDYRFLPKETLSIKIEPTDYRNGVNPTDQYIFPKWTVPGSTEPPALPWIPGETWLGAATSPATIWTIPDYSWSNDENASRRLRLPPLIGGLRTDEIQEFYFDGRVYAGSYKLKLGAETTEAIAWNASPQDVENALVALAQITKGDVAVSRAPATDERQTVEVRGGCTNGTFTLSLEGQTTQPIPFGATAGQVYSALARLQIVSLMGLTVTEDSQNCTQKFRISNEPTRGTFRFSLDGVYTDPIPHDATALQVENAIARLPDVGLLAVSVTKKFGQPEYEVKFHGRLEGVPVNLLVADIGELGGGAGIEVPVEYVQEGYKVYTVTFTGTSHGVTFQPMVGHPDGLTGGDQSQKRVVVETITEGSRPFKVAFKANKSGINMPLLQADVSLLQAVPSHPVFVAFKTRVGNTTTAENAIIDTDPRVEQVVSESGSQLWSRMNGVRFRHPIPPYTPSGKFEITVSGANKGQMVTLRLPRPWSRPWGLE